MNFIVHFVTKYLLLVWLEVKYLPTSVITFVIYKMRGGREDGDVRIYSTIVIIRQAGSLSIDETIRTQFSLNQKKTYLMLARHCAISG